MEQSIKQTTIICPICKSENPAVSVCLTCGYKIKHEQLNAKEFISRPVWLTVLAGFYALGFMKKAFLIMYQNNEVAVAALAGFAFIDIAIAYGLWQLRKWAWLVVVISCWFCITVAWSVPFFILIDPAEGIKFAYRPYFNALTSPFLLDSRITTIALSAAVTRAIISTAINGAILWYFYSNLIRGIFSDNPIPWRAAKY